MNHVLIEVGCQIETCQFVFTARKQHEYFVFCVEIAQETPTSFRIQTLHRFIVPDFSCTEGRNAGFFEFDFAHGVFREGISRCGTTFDEVIGEAGIKPQLFEPLHGFQVHGDHFGLTVWICAEVEHL